MAEIEALAQPIASSLPLTLDDLLVCWELQFGGQWHARGTRLRLGVDVSGFLARLHLRLKAMGAG